MASSTLIETININADDFTDNFLTCPTCMSAYDEADHTPKLLPCSHTLCRSCLERIASSATAVTSPGGVSDAVMASSSIATNSIARTIAAADAAVAAMNAMSSTAAALSPSSSSSNSQLNESSRQNGHGQGSVASSRLSSSSLASSSNRNSSGGSGLLHSNLSSQSGAQQSLIVDMCIRCPICRESIILPRNGGVLSLPPSFIINQLLDLVKSKKSRDIIPRCTNHTNEELLFCETCDKSFCSICESHFKSTPANADHIIVPFSIAIKRMAEIYLFKSNQCISSFNLALSNVQNEIINLNSTVENVVQLVDESFNELKRVLDKRRHELFKQLTKIKENKTTLLNEQIKLIVNERQKVEIECKRYQQQEASNLVESKLLCAQIQNINEKLDCLRTLCEPRENSFIDYEYKFNDCMDDIDGVMRRFGRFKISNTYPPLCTARILDDTVFNALANTSQSNSKESVYSTSRHLSVTIQIDTVDYYGKKRTEGGDPISIIITDPSMSRLQYTTQKPHQKPPEKLDQEPAIVDQNNGSYRFTFTPNLIGRYRLDISIFSRSIYQMPIFVVVNEFADPLWTFGGVSSNASSNSMASSTPTTSSSTLLRNFSFHNKGTGDRDFNMPICVRCVDKLIYILDSGNDRIKILNKNGQFVGNIKYEWLNGSSSTALALHVKNNTVSLITLNWRLKSMSKYNLETKTAESFTLAELDEPIAISETFHPDLFIVQDNKRKLYLCTSFGSVLYDSLEARLKTACNIKSVVCLCGDPFERRIFLAGITANNSPSPIYEISLDWLCDFRLDEVLKTLDPVHMPKPNLTSNVVSNSTFQAFTYPDSQDQQKSLSSSLTSLTSTVSVTSTTTTLTSNSTGCGGVGHSKTGQHSTTSSYTALWYDTSTQKLLAAKSDKQKTVIEIFNSCTRSYEYSISESSAKKSSSEKQLKKVTSICSTDDGRFLCVDLVQNLVKFFRFT